jgi:hypothetical protein
MLSYSNIVLPADIVGSSTNLFHTPKLSSMGIVLKRRDAPITKVVYGGVLDDSAEQERPSRRIVRTFQSDETSGRRCAHRTTHHQQNSTWHMSIPTPSFTPLAKRMRERDPGSAPQINDRVQYAFVVTDNPKALQADRGRP